jgi:hypothetical protein
MLGQKVQVKLYAQERTDAPLDSYVKVFHRWIQRGALDELMIDVADYSHVPSGPGIMLIGHGSDYALDMTDGRPGLLYSRKRDLPKGKGMILDALHRALGAAKMADEDAEVEGPRDFGRAEICFRFPDRLHVKNDEAGFLLARPAVEEALAVALSGQNYTLTRMGETREPLCIRAEL